MDIAPFVDVSEYVDVESRASELNCRTPTGLAVLPRNFWSAESKEELRYDDSAPTVRVLLRRAGVAETHINSDGERIPYLQQNGFEWIGPIVFIGGSVFTHDPHLIAISLNLISAYVWDFLKGVPGSHKTAKLNLVIPLSNSSKYGMVSYAGPPEGLKDLPKIIREVRDGSASPNRERR